VSFCEEVCNLVKSGDVSNLNDSIGDFLSDKVTSTSMCLVLAWKTGLEVSAMAPK
jgi:hypothetical protein